MIYEVGPFLSGRPSPGANHSPNSGHFLRTGCEPCVVPLPALLPPLLIYLIDYESNPCIIPRISPRAFTARRLKTISRVFDLLAPSFGADFQLKNQDYLEGSDLVRLFRCRRSSRRSQIAVLSPSNVSQTCIQVTPRI